MLAVQTVSVTCLFFWALTVTFFILWTINKFIPIRLSPEDEILGCDIVEHFMGSESERNILTKDILLSSRHPPAQVTLSISSAPHRRDSYVRDNNSLKMRAPFHINSGFEPAVSYQSSDRL